MRNMVPFDFGPHIAVIITIKAQDTSICLKNLLVPFVLTTPSPASTHVITNLLSDTIDHSSYTPFHICKNTVKSLFNVASSTQHNYFRSCSCY